MKLTEDEHLTTLLQLSLKCMVCFFSSIHYFQHEIAVTLWCHSSIMLQWRFMCWHFIIQLQLSQRAVDGSLASSHRKLQPHE